MHPIKPPTAQSDAIHEVSSSVILPVGNGDESEVRIIILGLSQPPPTAVANPNKLTFKTEIKSVYNKIIELDITTNFVAIYP